MSKIGDTKVRQGGLMRCCIQTLIEDMERDVQVGDTIDCKYETSCDEQMIVAEDGVIEWNQRYDEDLLASRRPAPRRKPDSNDILLPK
jgi:hypothetical protein